MIARLENAAALGLILSSVTFLCAWLLRRRSARDRAAMWGVGLATVLAASMASLLVSPRQVTLRLQRASAFGAARPSIRPGPLVVPPRLEPSLPVPSPAVRRRSTPRRVALPESLVALWLVVALALLARWGFGFARAAAMLRGAAPLDPALAARARAVAAWRPEIDPGIIRLHSGISVPLTVSLFRSVVLLPLEARGWRDQRLVAVLAHELAHVRRADGLVRSLARLCAVLHWFNPLVWLASRRLEEDQEVAADDAILEAGWLPSCYARELLAIADSLERGGRRLTLALPMVQRGGLMARLSLILGPRRRYAFSPRLVATFGTGLAVLAAGLVAIRPALSFAGPRATPAPVTVSARAEDGGYAVSRGASDGGSAFPGGDGSELLAAGQARPGGLAVDAANLYWLNFEGGTVMELSRSGGDAIALATGQAGPQSIAVDAERVYWSDFGDGTIRSVPIAGGDPRLVAEGQDRPSGIALGSGDLYWVTRDGSLWGIALSGGEPERFVAGTGSGEIEARALVSDGASLYWTEPGSIAESRGRILRYDRAAHRVVVLAERQDSPCRLAVDGTNVYWTNLGTRDNRLVDGAVMKVPREGGTPVVLAAGQLQPLGIAVDASNLYWTRAPLEDPAHGIVMRLPLAGGKPAVAAWQQRRPAVLALDAGGVYWTDAEDGTIRSLKE